MGRGRGRGRRERERIDKQRKSEGNMQHKEKNSGRFSEFDGIKTPFALQICT